MYEWEQEETEGCSRAGLRLASLTESEHYSAADHGCLYLLSSGTGREVERFPGSPDGTVGGSHLLGASEGLADVYIETIEPMTGTQGVDNVPHVYDVRQDGGFPPPAPCPRGLPAGSLPARRRRLPGVQLARERRFDRRGQSETRGRHSGAETKDCCADQGRKAGEGAEEL